MNVIKVKKLRDDAVIPFYSREGDAAFDLVSVENRLISPQATAGLGTGLAFEIPSGYEVEIVPRSGISLKTPLRLANAPGTIDENYRGEIKILLHNSIQQLHNYIVDYEKKTLIRTDLMVDYVIDIKGNSVKLEDLEKELNFESELGLIQFPTFIVRKGDKIAQGKLREVNKTSFEVVESLSDTERGENGFGSSGMSV